MKEKPTQQALLNHYADSQPTRFIQIDGFSGIGEHETVLHPDSEADALCSVETWELMTGTPDVRLLITGTARKEDVVRLVAKINEWVKQGDFFEVGPDLKLDVIPF